MSEFEFTIGSLEAQGLHAGATVVCTRSSLTYFTVGKLYVVVENIHGDLYLEDDEGDGSDSNVFVSFKPVQVSGQLLQDVLATCKVGDTVQCIYRRSVYDFLYSTNYRVITDCNGEKCILDEGNNQRYNTSHTLFIKKDVQSSCTQTKDEHDSWGIGKSYSAPKKEWQPDVMDVDLTKKIWEW